MWRKTVIDLTALLDVILIMLYFVLANAGAAAAIAMYQWALQWAGFGAASPLP